MKLFFLILISIFCFFLLFLFSSFKIKIKKLKIDTTSNKVLQDYDITIGWYLLYKVRIIGITITEERLRKLEKSKIIKFIVNNKKVKEKDDGFINKPKDNNDKEKNKNKYNKNDKYKKIDKAKYKYKEKANEQSQLNESNIQKIKRKIADKIEEKVKNDIRNGKYNRKIILEYIKIVIKNLKIETQELNINVLIGTEDILVTSYLIPLITIVISFFIKLTTKKIGENYHYEITPQYNKNLVKLDLNCIIQLKLVHIINIIYSLAIKKRRSDKYERTSNRRAYDYSHG